MVTLGDKGWPRLLPAPWPIKTLRLGHEVGTKRVGDFWSASILEDFIGCENMRRLGGGVCGWLLLVGLYDSYMGCSGSRSSELMCCSVYVGYMQVIRDGVMGRAAWSL